MKEIERTNTCIYFENNGKFANMIIDNSHNRYYKVVAKGLDGTVEILATRCTYDKAYNIIKDFLK